MIPESLVTNLPVAAAIILVVAMFLSFIRQEREKDREMWTNHLSEVSESLHKITISLEKLAFKLDRIEAAIEDQK